MKITLGLLLFALGVALSAGGAWAGETAAQLVPVRIAVVSRGTLDLPFWVVPDRVFDFSFARKPAEGVALAAV